MAEDKHLSAPRSNVGYEAFPQSSRTALDTGPLLVGGQSVISPFSGPGLSLWMRVLPDTE